MAVATTLVFTLIDDKGKSSNTKIKVPSTFAIADYIQFAQGAAQLIANISNARVTGVSINLAVDLSSLGLKTIAGLTSSVGAKMQGLFNTVSGILAKWLIPAPLETDVVAGSDDFDQTDPQIAALVTAMEDGIAVTSATMQFTNGRGDDITALSELEEVFRRRAIGK